MINVSTIQNGMGKKFIERKEIAKNITRQKYEKEDNVTIRCRTS